MCRTLKSTVLSILILHLGLEVHVASGQDPYVSSFPGNGYITWTNAVSNKLYSIEWAASLTGTWHSAWDSIMYMQGTNSLMQAPIPSFFRIHASDPASNVSPWIIRYEFDAETNSLGDRNDIPVPADYDGDGRVDVATYTPSNGLWRIIRSSDGLTNEVQWGTEDAIPAPADYDNDGVADRAVYNPVNTTWYIDRSGSGILIASFGTTSGIPVPADYNGDGFAELAIYEGTTLVTCGTPLTVTQYVAAIPQTGQSTSYGTGDDGDVEAGLEWPNPRFTVDSTGSNVLDNLTGLMWTKDALAGSATTQTWAQALSFCNDLDYGGYSDWRLPNVRELFSLTDWSRTHPALPLGHPFLNTGTLETFWTSTSHPASPASHAFTISGLNFLGFNDKTSMHYVWPVRTHTGPSQGGGGLLTRHR